MEDLIVSGIQWTLGLLVQFIVFMKLNSKYQDESWFHPVRAVIGAIFQPQNVAVNWCIFSFIFLDIPEQWNDGVTDRMVAYKTRFGYSRSKANFEWAWLERWRYNFAVRLCNILNRSDPYHC